MLTPLEMARIRAIPIIPIDPATEVRIVRPFFFFKLSKDRANAVHGDIDDLFFLPVPLPFLVTCDTGVGFSIGFSSERSNGLLSPIILPSLSFTILFA